ncbi:hypothetical protein KAS14_05090 [Candidatus Bathyarchaeota archaeon]|nr:hypothetical protein [Candidatus Bathyarchaeota archaeon]
MKSKNYLFILRLFISATIVFDVAFANNYFPVLKDMFQLLRYKPIQYVLSDLLFIEGAMFLIVGIYIAGVDLSKMVVPGFFKADYAKSILNWKLLQRETQKSPALISGLVLLGTGTIYIVVAIIITL